MFQCLRAGCPIPTVRLPFTTHPHWYQQPPIRSVKALKSKMEKLQSKYSFHLPTKQQIKSSFSEKVDVLKEELNSTSTYIPTQLTRDKLILHNIDTLKKIDVKMDKYELPTFYWLPKLYKIPYKSRFISNSSHCSTTILSKHITCTPALAAVKDHVIEYSETAFSNSNVNYFWSIKTLPRSSKSCECVTIRVLMNLLSTFPLYTLIATKRKCCLLLTGVLTESQKRTSVLQP